MARMVGVATLALVATASCAREPSEINWPANPSPNGASRVIPSPTLSPDELVATEEILSVVHRYREVEVAAFAAPPVPPTARELFSDVLADPLLTETLATISTMRTGGVVFEGQPSSAPMIAALRLDEEPATATVVDCIHAADWRPVFAETGQPVPGEGMPARFSARLQLKRYPDGWLIHELELGEADWCLDG